MKSVNRHLSFTCHPYGMFEGKCTAVGELALGAGHYIGARNRIGSVVFDHGLFLLFVS